MRDYYADFLQNKNSVNTLPNEVSKVSKGQNVKTKQTFDTFDTASSYVNQKKYAPKTNDDLARLKDDMFHEVLNGFIKSGITFEVSADDFQTIDRGQILRASDREFIQLNNAAILCYLQQSALMKHLFDHSPEQFEDFAFEIIERESVLDVEGMISYELYFTAVCEITKKWFKNLLKKW